LALALCLAAGVAMTAEAAAPDKPPQQPETAVPSESGPQKPGGSRQVATGVVIGILVGIALLAIMISSAETETVH
jgi:hypothetical protein